jgi:hypothetical protein
MSGLTGVAWGSHAAGEAAQASAIPVEAFDKLIQPVSNVSTPVAASPAEAAPAPDSSSIAKRLQTLQHLFEQKLIDENEYKQQKERILKEL